MHTGPEVAGCRSSFLPFSLLSFKFFHSLFFICLLYFFSSRTIDQLTFCLHFLHCRHVVVTFSDFKDREEVRNIFQLSSFWTEKHTTGFEKSRNAQGEQCLCYGRPLQVKFPFDQRTWYFLCVWEGLFERGETNYLLQTYKTMSSGASEIYAQC